MFINNFTLLRKYFKYLLLPLINNKNKESNSLNVYYMKKKMRSLYYATTLPFKMKSQK